MAGERETELVLPPGEYAYIKDNTKGHVNVHVGPTKTNVSNTDEMVVQDDQGGFRTARLAADAIKKNVTAAKGQYIVLSNPARDGRHPDVGNSNILMKDLLLGERVIVPGPISFALWPMQSAVVIPGHQLRSNQYLLGRVYDEDKARENWNRAIFKETTDKPSTPATNTKGSDGKGDSKGDEKSNDIKGDVETKPAKKAKSFLGIDPETLYTGQIFIIRGTEVAFYIPPTGVEVMQVEVGNEKRYIQDAVTLESLEYCILLDENGQKRYVRGPDVVFPAPTEQFIMKPSATDASKMVRKFRAYELNETTGLLIKVISDYEEGRKKYTAGEELFITGKDTPIYYPRAEHALITYGAKHEKHYATAVPLGEGRYVLNRLTGAVTLEKGPVMLLPDPRTHVMLNRVLSQRECELYYPGNQRVLDHNLRLAGLRGDDGHVHTATLEAASLHDLNEMSDKTFSSRALMASTAYGNAVGAAPLYTSGVREKSNNSMIGDSLNRGEKFTPPRSITLNNKLDGAVQIKPFTGYAVQVVNGAGERRVVVGPQTILLGYDEYLQPLTLSKGNPKNADDRTDTVYLKINSNSVSDTVTVRTSDKVDVRVSLKYLVEFGGADSNKWFAIDNYVQFLVDRMRSMITNMARHIGVEEFDIKNADMIRDLVLGTKREDGTRPGYSFDENGMTVYDLEITGVHILDTNVEEMLSDAHTHALTVHFKQRALERDMTLHTFEQEQTRKRLTEVHETESLKKIQTTKLELLQHDRDVSIRKAQLTVGEIDAKISRLKAETQTAIERLTMAVADEKGKAEIERLAAKVAVEIEQMVKEGEVNALVLKEIQPDLIAAFQALAASGTMQSMAEHLSSLSIVKDQSLIGTLRTMVAGTPLEAFIANLDNVGKGKLLPSTRTGTQ